MVNIFNIKDKVIVFTGATGHLGKVISDHLESEGAKVIRVSRSEKSGDMSFGLDISDDMAVQEFASQLRDRFGKIDGIVNNAYSGNTGELHNHTRDDFERSVNMSLTSPFFLIKHLLPYINEGASIINMTSMYGMVSPDPRIYGDSGQNSPVYYGAGKAGLIQISRYLACHLSDKKIRVNSVSPGAFPNFSQEQLGGSFHQNLENKIPLGRIGEPRDLNGVVQFLISDASLYINGMNLPVDGGWTAW